ncbi:MAG: MFS transporter [Promethearchaeota archaeon]
MVKKLSKQELFSFILVMVLIFLNNAVMNMLIPSYGPIVKEFKIPESIVALPDSAFVLVSAGLALVWGYYTDKIDRTRVIFMGAFFWCVGCIITAFSYSYFSLFIARMVTGAGLGCVLPVGMSIIADIVPEEERAGYLGGVAILSSISNAVGNSLSAFLGPLNIWGLGWRFPFFIIAAASVLVVMLLMFAKLPKRGSTEAELAALQDLDLEYNYQIERKDIVEIMKKPTNRYLFIQGFFAIVPGTILIFYIQLIFTNTLFVGLPDKILLQTATIFAGMIGVGYLVGNVVLSALGDYLFKKNKKNRVRLGAVTLILAIPTGLVMLLMMQPINAPLIIQDIKIPVDPTTGEYVIPDDQVMSYVFAAVGAIFTRHPNYAVFFVFSLIASFMSAGGVSNRNATVLDVNLPEHRGTGTSLFRLSESVGKGVTLALAGMLIVLLGSTYRMLVASIFFWVPAAICWVIALKHVTRDLEEKSMTLIERSQMTLIDYLFELEIAIDRGLQKVQDAKFFLNTNLMKSEDMISDALAIFTHIHELSVKRNLEDTAVRSLQLQMKTSTLLDHLHSIIYKRTESDMASITSDLAQIQMKIDEFEKSDLNKIEILYESGYLRVCEARLERKRDDLAALVRLQTAIKTFTRVERLVSERLEGKSEEDEDYKRLTYLLEKARNSKENTTKLMNELQMIFNRLKQEGIDVDDLRTISELSAEYEVNVNEVLQETVGEETANAIQQISEDIDNLFREYDEWEAAHPHPLQELGRQKK